MTDEIVAKFGLGQIVRHREAAFRVIDESFCDVTPAASHMASAPRPGTLILKSFGKFWGLAGLRLGFAIGDPALIADLRPMIGPWAVSGPALSIATAALSDPAWADTTRARLAADTDSASLIAAGIDHCRTSPVSGS